MDNLGSSKYWLYMFYFFNSITIFWLISIAFDRIERNIVIIEIQFIEW